MSRSSRAWRPDDEAFLDLLDPPEAGGGSKKLSVAEGSNFTFLKGATFVSVSSADAAIELITRGAAFRAHGKTNMNDASSRSHAILLLAVGAYQRPELATATLPSLCCR